MNQENTYKRSALNLLIFIMVLDLCAGASVVERHKNEEMASGTEVADLPNIFGLTWQERRTRTFKLLSQKLVTRNPEGSTAGDEWVKLDPANGKITLAKRNDREEMCAKAQECIVQMQVVMLPQQFFTLLNIDLYIDDTNDHTPRFSSTRMQVNVSEEVRVDDVINIDYIQAIDKDIGENAKLSYKITPNDFFDVDQSVDEAGTNHLQLIVKSPIDYEEMRVQTLKLVASDGGSPPRSDQIDLQINTIDENDNAPVFDSVEYDCKLKESDEIGSVITTVHASDKDSGLYGRVQYFLPDLVVVDQATALAHKLLTVNKSTGDIILKERPRRSDHDRLKVMVEARDMDPEKPKIGKVWIKLSVEDVNDNDPTISVNFIVEASNNTAFVPESEKRGVYIAYVSASDKDNGKNGETEISIRTSSVNGKALDEQYDHIDPHFVLERGELIGIAKNLNRETINRYMLTITACDRGQPSRCSEKTIKILVLDVNDFAPQFTTKIKKITVFENGDADVVIDTLQATDGDARNLPATVLHQGRLVKSNYGTITYSIAKGNSKLFAVGATTGQLRLLRPLDYEKKESWELIVNAKDGGGKLARSSNITVVVNVVDTNDNPPVFVNPVRNDTTVYATTLKDQLVMRIKAKDSDIGENSKLAYEIIGVDGSMINGKRKLKSIFLLHPSNGALRLNFSNPNISDYLGPHKLVIQVTDSGQFPLKRSATLIVHITDTNVAVPILYGEVDIKIMIMIGVISLVFVVLVIILLCALISCRRRNKDSRTYNCRNAESKTSKVWITREDEQDTMYDSRSPSRGNAESVENEKMKASQVSINGDNRNEYTSLIFDNKAKASNPAKLNEQEMSQGSLTTFAYEERKRSGLEVPVFPSCTVDRDSGRGDSDPEMVLHETSGGQQNESLAKGSVSSSDMAPRCSSACLEHGHSDSCWMPSPTRHNSIDSSQALSYSRSSASRTPLYPQYPQQYKNDNHYVNHLNSPDSRIEDYSYEMPDYPPPPSIIQTSQVMDQHRYTSPTYNNELNPISEIDDPVQYDPNYDLTEGDDVSVHTQLALSTDVIQPYLGSQSQLSIVPSYAGSRTNSLCRHPQYNEPPAIQRTAHPHEYGYDPHHHYRRTSSRLSSCSSNNSASHQPRNVPHRNNPYKNVYLPPYPRTNNLNYNNNVEASTLPRLHQENVPLRPRHYSSTDYLTEAPKVSSLDSYYQNNNSNQHSPKESGEVTMEETNNILKSIEQLLEHE